MYGSLPLADKTLLVQVMPPYRPPRLVKQGSRLPPGPRWGDPHDTAFRVYETSQHAIRSILVVSRGLPSTPLCGCALSETSRCLTLLRYCMTSDCGKRNYRAISLRLRLVRYRRCHLPRLGQ